MFWDIIEALKGGGHSDHVEGKYFNSSVTRGGIF